MSPKQLKKLNRFEGGDGCWLCSPKSRHHKWKQVKTSIGDWQRELYDESWCYCDMCGTDGLNMEEYNEHYYGEEYSIEKYGESQPVPFSEHILPNMDNVPQKVV